MDRFLRLILAGVVAGFILFLSAGFVYNLRGEISDPSLRILFKETISMKWFYKLLLLNIGTGLFMAFLYPVLGKAVAGSDIFRGIFWGFMVWIIMVHQQLIFRLVFGMLSTELLIS
ncbi:MAG TPA: hypothetical protein ENN43_06325, partial [bacterium]|nr:hypothetical protein [bacterium]